MTTSKKILSVVLAIIMVVSCFAVSASAYTYAPSNTTGEIKISITADKTTVNPGDVVTFQMHMDRGTKGPLAGMNTTILFNSALLTPVGDGSAADFRTWEGDCGNSYANPSAAVNWNFPVSRLTNLTAEEKAMYTRAVMIMCTSTSSANRWNPEPGEAYVTFRMKVADNAAPGETWIGAHEAAYIVKASNLSVDGKQQAIDQFDLSNSMIKLTVAGGEVSAPVLTKAASQVKMTLTSATTVAEPFQYRVISKISGDDWNEYFANTGTENAGTNAITSVGFVAYKGAAAFDLETAKAVANGATAADYAAKETDYIQYDGSEAKFGCRIDFTAKPENDVTYIAYAKYLDANGAAQVVFYDAAESSPVASKYTEMVAAYVGLYGSTFVG